MGGICSKCGLPKEVCICEHIAKEQQVVRISSDRRRYGKIVTVIDGINGSEIDIEHIAKELKTKCATGGTVKNGRIELQGGHVKKVQETLEKLGFTTEITE